MTWEYIILGVISFVAGYIAAQMVVRMMIKENALGVKMNWFKKVGFWLLPLLALIIYVLGKWHGAW